MARNGIEGVTDLSSLAQYVAGWMEIPKILARCTPSTPLSLEGVTGAAQGILCALLQENAPSPLLVLTVHQDEAEQIAAEIQLFLETPFHCLLYPALLALPNERIATAPEILGRRFTVLQELTQLKNGKPSQHLLIVSSLKAALEKTMSQDAFQNAVIKIGGEIDQEHLVRNLVKMGYTQAPMVTEPGELSVRGGLIDLFPSHLSTPLRLDFFGDSLESIHTFDVSSQRRTLPVGNQETLFIFPAKLSETSTRESLFHYFPKETPILFANDRAAFENHFEQLKLEAAAILLEREKPKTSVNAIEKENLPTSLLTDPEKNPAPPTVILTEAAWQEELTKRSLLYLNSLTQQASENKIDLPFKKTPSVMGEMDPLFARIRKDLFTETFVVVSQQAERLKELFEQAEIPVRLNAPVTKDPVLYLIKGNLREGFSAPYFTLLTDHELFGERVLRYRARRESPQIKSNLVFNLNLGSYIVHEHHGIGIYQGLKTLEIEGAQKEFAEIAYAEGDKLYVPPEQTRWLYPYASGNEKPPSIHRLGGTDWQKTKRKAQKAASNLARELLEMDAIRARESGTRFPPDQAWQMELEASFPYEATPDQHQAIQAVKQDMENAKPMDRLICGDVGYGKTEVALRATFKAACGGKQIAILVPTTLLAQQHYDTFRERFRPFPIQVEMLSRFRSKQEQTAILAQLAIGQTDVIIGTHRLLQKDIKFKDLGLLIIDEEQRFGVKHKETLKKLKATLDILSLTATPIPRTLYLSLSGARDMSLITTAPQDRSPIHTTIAEYDETLIRDAILRERERDGQVFYVHNRVQTIFSVAERLRRLVPAAKIEIAHGQMEEHALATVMLAFIHKKIDVLVSTTIIESGLDIPNANTMIIDHAHQFGLAELYQLRGRIGRSHQRAFATLLYHPGEVLTDTAQARLAALRDFTALGSGYRLAMKDLEIRGSGNLLGKEQHGHMVAVGFDLYCRLLSRMVEEMKSGGKKERVTCTLKLKMPAHFPPDYIPDERQRTALYQRLSLLETLEMLHDLQDEIKDRFGSPPPAPAQNLFLLIELKIRAEQKGIQRIEEKEGKIWIDGKPTRETLTTLPKFLGRKLP